MKKFEKRIRKALRSTPDAHLPWINEVATLLTEMLHAIEIARPTVAEAGSAGGKKVHEQYGHEHFQDVGSKGGRTTSERYGPEFFREVGQKGAAKLLEKYGPDYYSQLGKRKRNRKKKSDATAPAASAAAEPSNPDDGQKASA